MRNRAAAVLAFSAFATSTTCAQEFTSPQDLLGTLYLAYQAGIGVTDLSPYFSDRLTSEMVDAWLSPEVIALMGVDPLVGATNPEITEVNIGRVQQGEPGSRVRLDITFKNRSVPVSLSFELVHEEKHGWQIDHLEGRSGDVTWCSNSIVEASKRLAGD